MRPQDLRRIEERAWRIVLAMADRLPLPYGRRLLSGLGRICSHTMSGYQRTCERLITGNNLMVRVPPRYWSGPDPAPARRFGVRLNLDLRDNVQRCLYFTGTYEPETTRLISRSVRAGELLVDVGAHIGVHSLAAASVPGVKVVSFEPMLDSAQTLSRTVWRSTRDIEVVALALGDADGRVSLRASLDWGLHDAGVRSAFNSGPVVGEAQVVRFDEWNHDRRLRPSVVKIDVEGLELAVLRGMESLLTWHPPRTLVVELKEPLLERAGTTRSEVVKMLKGFGYLEAESMEYNQVFRLKPDTQDGIC